VGEAIGGTHRLKSVKSRLIIYSLGLAALFLAASLVSLAPIVILFASLQRFFVEGVASSGLKG
jgi:ABC-type maltose transport system permease subunit